MVFEDPINPDAVQQFYSWSEITMKNARSARRYVLKEQQFFLKIFKIRSRLIFWFFKIVWSDKFIRKIPSQNSFHNTETKDRKTKTVRFDVLEIHYDQIHLQLLTTSAYLESPWFYFRFRFYKSKYLKKYLIRAPKFDSLTPWGEPIGEQLSIIFPIEGPYFVSTSSLVRGSIFWKILN